MKRALVAGGAGFIGSHLCETLIKQGYKVVVLDNFSSGSPDNLELLDPAFCEVREQDVRDLSVDSIEGPLDLIFNLASAASPDEFSRRPLDILETNALGQRALLNLSLKKSARLLFASTSEVYGDPIAHPQKETDWGHVNCVGPRSCYDEGKRFAEALTLAYHQSHSADICIARIFNTYGPRMRWYDGRLIPNLFRQALRTEAMTIHGDGQQTRSLCYVSDMVKGLIALAQSSIRGPVNLGNPHETTVLDLARRVQRITSTSSSFEYLPAREEDPKRRCPDISLAQSALGWAPKVSLTQGLEWTCEDFRRRDLP